MDELRLAEKIRLFFEDLFQSKLVSQLTQDLMYARSDAERMRKEYQEIIVTLRADKDKLETRMIMYDAKAGIRPLNQPAVKPQFDFSVLPPVKTKWQVVQDLHDAKIALELEQEEKERLAKEAKASGD